MRARCQLEVLIQSLPPCTFTHTLEGPSLDLLHRSLCARNSPINTVHTVALSLSESINVIGSNKQTTGPDKQTTKRLSVGLIISNISCIAIYKIKNIIFHDNIQTPVAVNAVAFLATLRTGLADK